MRVAPRIVIVAVLAGESWVSAGQLLRPSLASATPATAASGLEKSALAIVAAAGAEDGVSGSGADGLQSPIPEPSHSGWGARLTSTAGDFVALPFPRAMPPVHSLPRQG